MADTTTKIVTLSTLSYYDGKIKEYIAAEDAKSLKTVVIDGNVLKFYRTEEPLSEDAVVAYEIELPEADLSNLLEKLNVTAGNVVTVAENGKDIVDSGVAVADLATKSEVETIAEKVAEALQNQAKES